MQAKSIGRSNLKIFPLIFGGNVFGWTVDERTSFELLDAFLEAGFNCIDTADCYSNWIPGNPGGISEAIIGKWMKSRQCRHKVVISTKVGLKMKEQRGLSKDHILRSIDESLKRLQTDYVDLYFSHRDDLSWPVEEPLSAYEQLMQQGKVKAIGASNFEADRLEQALKASEKHGYPRYECLQPLYNLYDRAVYERPLQPVCTKYGIGVITYFSLACGFLTGKYRSKEDLLNNQRADLLGKYFTEKGFRILSTLDQVAKKKGLTPAHISIAWLLAQPNITAAIASATSVEQLNTLIEATQLHLDQESIALLNKASD